MMRFLNLCSCIIILCWFLDSIPSIHCQQQGDGGGDGGDYYDPDGPYYSYDQPPEEQGPYYDSGAADGATDHLYHDYAARQYTKEAGAIAPTNGGWMGTVGTLTAGGLVGWVVGAKYHTRRVSKKLYETYKKDQKILYQQYYNDVYTLQKQNAELIDTLEQYIMATTGKPISSSSGSGAKTISSGTAGGKKTSTTASRYA